jgi:hypothetical protein
MIGIQGVRTIRLCCGKCQQTNIAQKISSLNVVTGRPFTITPEVDTSGERTSELASIDNVAAQDSMPTHANSVLLSETGTGGLSSVSCSGILLAVKSLVDLAREQYVFCAEVDFSSVSWVFCPSWMRFCLWTDSDRHGLQTGEWRPPLWGPSSPPDEDHRTSHIQERTSHMEALPDDWPSSYLAVRPRGQDPYTDRTCTVTQ